MVSSENIERFLYLCIEGGVDEVAELLRQDPTLIKCKHEESGYDQFKIKNRKGRKRLLLVEFRILLLEHNTPSPLYFLFSFFLVFMLIVGKIRLGFSRRVRMRSRRVRDPPMARKG